MVVDLVKMSLSFKYHLMSLCWLMRQWPTVVFLEHLKEILKCFNFSASEPFAIIHHHSTSVTVFAQSPSPFLDFSDIPQINFSYSNWRCGLRVYIRIWFILVLVACVCPVATEGEFRLMEVASWWPTFVVLLTYWYM